MRSTTLRWIMLGCSVIIAMILLAQLYWLKRVYNLEEQQFKSGIVKSIKGLFGDIEISKDPRIQMNQVISKLDDNTYQVRIDAVPSKDSLEHYLHDEFEEFDILADCNVALFDSKKQNFAYQFYMSSAGSGFAEPFDVKLQLINKEHDYLLLNFPHRSKYIIHEMLFWIVGAIFLLLILIGLTISLLYLYRQKFLNELQKDFVDNFTHEFKTPLAVMKIAGDVIVKPDIIQKPERLQKYSALMLEQTEHLQRQVERLLKTTAGNSSKLILKKEPCQLNLLVQTAIDQIDPLIQNKNAKVELITDENEPVIYADNNHLQLVIINLVENALKYCKNQPHIIVQLQNGDSDFYTISVKDNGIGIDKKNIKHLFNKFYRVPTGNVHDVTGFGLGLNFVKKVIDAHNGKISINSVPGIGTEFRIQLPKK